MTSNCVANSPTCPNANFAEIYACSNYLQVWRRSGDQNWGPYWSDNVKYRIFGTQCRVTLKSIGRISYSSEMLCLAWLSASLMKIRKKMKAPCAGQHLPHYKSMGKCFDSQPHPNIPISLKFELHGDFVLVLVICKFDEDPAIKMKTLPIGQQLPHYIYSYPTMDYHYWLEQLPIMYFTLI